jgi:hypothetical protein
MFLVIEDNHADIVIGSRFLDDRSKYKTSMLKHAGIRVFRAVIKMFTVKTLLIRLQDTGV